MTTEWTGPTPQEILDGMLQAGRTKEEIFYGLNLINEGIKEGEIRTKISCWENFKGFFEMADRFYVRNEGMALSDAELGMHMGQCKSPCCRKLLVSYYDLLRPSAVEDSGKISGELKELAKEVLLGKPRPDLEGKESTYYDSQTGEDLFEVKVVEITDKCIINEEYEAKMKEFTDSEREILLAYIPCSRGILCEIKQLHGEAGVCQAFNITKNMAPDMQRAFKTRASIIGIDPDLLKAVILANAPEEKLIK